MHAMNPKELKRIIAQGEKPNVEFRASLDGESSFEDLLESVVGLANSPGDGPARLLVGVDDGGKVLGVPPDAAEALPVLLASVAGRTDPSVHVTHGRHLVGGREVISMEVPDVGTSVCTTEGAYLWRVVGGDGRPALVPMPESEVVHRVRIDPRYDYTAHTVPEATWDDLDPLEFERFRSVAKERRADGGGALAGMGDRERGPWGSWAARPGRRRSAWPACSCSAGSRRCKATAAATRSPSRSWRTSR